LASRFRLRGIGYIYGEANHEMNALSAPNVSPPARVDVLV